MEKCVAAAGGELPLVFHQASAVRSRRTRGVRTLGARVQSLETVQNSLRIHGDDSLDASPTDSAKLIVSREHDAVYLRTVISFGLIICALESADLPPIFLARQRLVFVKLFLVEKLVHF